MRSRDAPGGVSARDHRSGDGDRPCAGGRLAGDPTYNVRHRDHTAREGGGVDDRW